MISDEFYRIYQRMGLLKYLLLSWFAWFLKVILFVIIGPMNCGFHTCYGDGTEIPDSVNKHIRDITWKNMVFNRWKKGDMIMIDNYRISHGRQVFVIYCLVTNIDYQYLFLQPYSGKRLIVVSWSKPYLRPSLHKKNE